MEQHDRARSENADTVRPTTGGRVDHVVDVSAELDVPAALLRPDGHAAWVGARTSRTWWGTCRAGSARPRERVPGD